MKKIGIIVLATNKYFVLGLRLLRRMSHFYNGPSELHFHFFSNLSPISHVSLKNMTFHKIGAEGWNGTMLAKLDAVNHVVENNDYDHYVYIDADSNVSEYFQDENFIADSFILKHPTERTDSSYEKNKLSAAYIDPSEYPQFYYQACYFGGTKENMLPLSRETMGWYKKDLKQNILVFAEDETYINKYLSLNPPTKLFDNINEKFFMTINDKGISTHHWGKYLKMLYSPKEYRHILNGILEAESKKLLWNIKNSRVVVE
jgi:hypothetical protein